MTSTIKLLKNSILNKIIAFVFGIVLFTPTTNAAFSFDPALTWHTIKTEHFNVHFHDGEELLAQQVAAMSERIHTRISNYFAWNPDDKTNVVLTDRKDFSNGSATPLPDNRMIIHVTPPDDINTLEDFDNYLELLLTHEYTHIVHMDKALRNPYNLRYLFGRFPLLFPNAQQPSWIIEGLATYLESDIERGIGRGQSSLFKMLMRLEHLNGLKPISMVNQPVQTWPSGRIRYLYGVYFFNFIADTYGADTIKTLVNEHSDNLIPYMINHTSKKIFGKNLSKLWKEYALYIKDQFEPQIKKITNRGIHAGHQLTHSGYIKKQIQTLPNGDIVYFEDDNQSESKLMLLKSGAQQAYEIETVRDGRFDVHANKGIILTQTDAVRNVNIFMDLYHIDLKTLKKTRLTNGKRYTYATWNSDGSRIIAVKNDAGNSSLELLNLLKIESQSNNNEPIVLWQGSNREVISHIDWSKDDKTLVASVWRPDTLWNLELFHIESHTWEKITNTLNIESHPLFTHDGQSIVYTADYESVFNIHKLDLSTRNTMPLTNLLGGGFYPSISLDNKYLYYSGYHTSGSDIYQMELPQENFNLTFARKRSTTPILKAIEKSEYTWSVSPYSSINSVLPKWWIPNISSINFSNEYQLVGLMTSGQDVLKRHQYNTQLNYEIVSNTVGGSLNYVYDRWDPAIALQFSRMPQEPLTGTTNDGQKVLYGRVKDDYIAQLILPILHFDWSLNFQTALIHSTSTLSVLNPKIKLTETTDTLAGIALSLDTTKKFPLSVSKSQGNRLRVSLENSDVSQGDFNGNVYIGDWRGYASLGKQHVLAAHIAGAWSDGVTGIFTLGGATSEGPVDVSFNKRDYSLRGFSNITGRNMFVSALEWRFPIRRVEKGIMAPMPIGLHQLYGNLFINAGNAWFKGDSVKKLYTAVGFELNAETVFFYNYLFNFRFGAAQGIGPSAPLAVTYFSINSSF